MGKFCGKCGQKVDTKTGLCPQCDQVILMKKKKRKKSVKAVIAVLCCISIITVGIFGALRFFNIDTVSYTYGEYNSFMEGFTDVLIIDENSAIEAVASIGDTLGIKDANSELKATFTNKRGTDNYYRLQQYYNDIPVFGRNITVVADESGKSLGLTSNYSPIEDIDTKPSLNEEKISEKISKAYDGVDSQTNNGLIVYTLYNSSPTLAYDVTVSKSNSDELIYEQCIISATKGDILLRNNLVRTDLEHSSDEYTYKVNDKTYLMYDESRNVLVLNSNKKLLNYETIEKDGVKYSAVSNDKKRNENANPLWDKNQTLICGDIKIEGSGKAKWKDDAVNLINSIENTYDFYSEILKWNGYDNKNSPMLSSYNDYFYSYGNNAYSQGNLLVFGYKKDLTDVGLVGHEFTHSVERTISGMLYSGESGAIMEAYSDIFGELAEDYAKDGILNGDCDWIHGSRNMIDPSVNNYPACYLDDNWESTVDTGENSDYGNVHTNNTVISHAAYLMNSGVSGNARIDNKSLAVMWFNALNMLQRDSSFSQCRNAVELSARIMLKNNQLTEEQYKTVVTAFERVGIENATFTYSKTVKNKFDLSVLSSKGTENVHFKLEVIKMPTIKAGPGIINNGKPKLVMEKAAITGRQSLDLKDGTYVFRITDVSDERNISKSINIKIVVDGDNSNAKDEVIVNTDFTDVIVSVLNDNSSDKLTENETQPTSNIIENPTDEDFEMLNEMLNSCKNAWRMGLNEDTTMVELLENYILWMYDYFYGETEWIPAPETSTKFADHEDAEYYSVKAFKADNVDWILKNVFGREPDHTINSDLCYYDDEFCYVAFPAGNGSLGQYKILDCFNLKNGGFGILATDYIEDGYDIYDCGFIYFNATLKYDTEIGPFWSIKEYSRNECCFDIPVGTTDMTEVFNAYKNALQIQIEKNNEVWDSSSDQNLFFPSYMVFDIDNDGITELLIRNVGTDEKHWYSLIIYSYDIKNKRLIELGSFEDMSDIIANRLDGPGTYSYITSVDGTELLRVHRNIDMSTSDYKEIILNVQKVQLKDNQISFVDIDNNSVNVEDMYKYDVRENNKWDEAELVNGIWKSSDVFQKFEKFSYY